MYIIICFIHNSDVCNFSDYEIEESILLKAIPEQICPAAKTQLLPSTFDAEMRIAKVQREREKWKIS